MAVRVGRPIRLPRVIGPREGTLEPDDSPRDELFWPQLIELYGLLRRMRLAEVIGMRLVFVLLMASSCLLVPPLEVRDAGIDGAGGAGGAAGIGGDAGGGGVDDGGGGEGGNSEPIDSPDASVDPCLNVVCDMPPADSCQDATTLRLFETMGSCAAGSCVYSASVLSCEGACGDAGCEQDACLGVVCNNPPADVCATATTVRSFANVGTCAPVDGGTRCDHLPMTKVCPSGQQCFDGVCSVQTPTCSSSNCQGCCDGMVCLQMSGQTPQKCGGNGTACRACSAGTTCQGTACVDVNECLTNNGGCHADASCTNTVGGRRCACTPGFVGDGGTCLAAPVWRRAATAGIDARWFASAYDAARNRVVVYGNGVTLLWDGVGWVQSTAVAGPGTRTFSAMAYDPVRQRTVLFGGTSNSVPTNDTWEWDGVKWVQMASTVRPPVRNRHKMVFNPHRNRIVMFGGCTAPVPMSNSTGFNDMWEWDGTRWTQVNITSSLPSPRWNMGLAYDRERRRLVMFGGETSLETYVRDTWEFDGTTWRLAAAAGGPSARRSPGMAFDERYNRTMLFGGSDNPDVTALSDTWYWNGTQWALETRPIARPGLRFHHGLIWNTQRQRIFVFGGIGSALTTVLDSWEFGP